MWCLETLEQLGQSQAKNAYDAYDACGIRILGNTKRNADNGTISDPAVPTGNVRDDDDDVES